MAFFEKITQKFWTTFITINIARLVLAYLFPITSDEAYFYLWGKYLAPAYYDHSFMTGLWVKAGLFIGEHIFFMRLIAIATQALVAILFLNTLVSLDIDKKISQLLTLIFVASPIQFLFLLMLTDTPLFLFSFLAGLFCLYGVKKSRVIWFLFAGVFLGLGLLSKYLIVFLAAGIFLLTLVYSLRQHVIKNLFALSLGFLPFLMFNFKLAQGFCWWPLQFNIANRTNDKGIGLTFVGLFLVYQILIITPWLLREVVKYKKNLLDYAKGQSWFSIQLFIIVTSLFALFSLLDSGLHYTISIFPFLILSLVKLPEQSLLKVFRASIVTSSILFLLLSLLVTHGDQFFIKSSVSKDYLIGKHGDALFIEVQNSVKEEWGGIEGVNLNDLVYGTFAYSTAAEMEYHSKVRHLVFGNHGKHGRNDDYWTNFKDLEGKNFVLLGTSKISSKKQNELSQLFNDYKIKTVMFKNIEYFVVMGRGFKYLNYLELHLEKINSNYFSFKEFLPQGQCFFKDRYFN